MKLSIAVAFLVLVVACTKADDKQPTPGSGSGAVGGGSAAAPATPPPTTPTTPPVAGSNAGSAEAGSGSDAVTVLPTERPLAVGDHVQGQWTDGRWYNGKIGAIQANGTYDINYNDGDHSKGLPGSKVRRPHAATGQSHASGGGGGDAPCPGPGLTRRCGGRCVNIQTDSNNCGTCGNRCSAGKSCDGHMFCRDAAGNL